VDLEETEVRNDCIAEDQQQFNRPTEKVSKSRENLQAISQLTGSSPWQLNVIGGQYGHRDPFLF
jgi:hypothetical protein